MNLTEQQRLAIMVDKLREAQRHVEQLEEELKAAKAEQRQIEEVDIPLLMDELDFDKVTLTDGKTLEVKDIFACSIPADRREAVARWLVDNDLGPLVKRKVSGEFDFEELEEAKRAFAQLKDHNATLDYSMNTNSVKAAAKELLANGESAPFDLLGLTHVRKARLK